MLRLTTFLFISWTSASFSQSFLPAGGRSNSLSNASVAFSDAWSFHHNPGALAGVTKRSFGISYENRFLIKELQSQAIVYVHPIKTGVLSVGGQLFGFSQFQRYRIGAGYSMWLSKKLAAGVQLNYQGISFNENYGSKNILTAECGILASISDQWKLGFSLFNIGRAKLTTNGSERIISTMRLGSNYIFSKNLLLAIEFEKNDRYPIQFKSGIEYQFSNHFFIRGGMSMQPMEPSFGIGYKSKYLQLDIGSTYQQVLGWSPHVSFTFYGAK